MKSVFVVNEGDQWLSSDSLWVKGVFESHEEAVKAIVAHLLDNCNKKGVKELVENYWEETYELSDELNSAKEEMLEEIVRQLHDISQTQGLEVNYIISEYNLNEWV